MLSHVISNKIQRYTGKYFSEKDFKDYMHALTEALQYYYCLDNVLAYTSNVTWDNTNIGMERLRSMISAECIVSYNLLKETLSVLPCPLNLLEYIRFMCQAYRTSDAQFSPIIKLNIGGMFDENWNVSTHSHISSKFDSLRNRLNKSSKMASYLIQAFPEWVIGNLPSSSNIACYNSQFMTFWHNQNTCCLDTNPNNPGNFVYSADVKTIDDYTDFQIITNVDDVDGTIFISNSYNTPSDLGPNKIHCHYGVWQPFASVVNKSIPNGDSRSTFNIKCLGDEGIIDSVKNSEVLGFSGIRNVFEYTGSPGNWSASKIKFGNHGFVKLQTSSIRLGQEAFNNSMRFWFI